VSKDFIELEGVVEEIHPNAMFTVLTEQGHKLMAHLSGKMKMNRIQVLLGDQVKLEVSPYDVTKGRITYRTK
jgi:translation initiation factor IF-1